MQSTIASFEHLQRVSGNAVDSASITAAQRELANAANAFNNIEKEIKRADEQQQKLNNDIRNGNGAANGLWGSIKSLAGAYLSFQGAKSLIQMSDEMVNTTARLGLMNDGLQTVAELQDMIFESAQRARGPYQQTADAVAKLGLQAGKAFSSTEEIVAFSEQINKTFTIAGTSAQGVESVMLQLTQAMAAGALQGEELNAILDNAQPIVANIQRYLQEVMGIDASNIKKLASEGILTADVIKNAMFYAAEDTNKAFESMPMTWGQIWTQTMNNLIKAMQPVLSFVNLLANNWDKISPIIWGLVAAVGAYTIALGLQTAATWVANGAAKAFFTTLLTNPFTWIALVIGVMVAALIRLWQTNDQFAAGLMRVWNGILNFFGGIPAFFWQVVESAATAFEWMAQSVGGIFDTVINGIISGINKVLEIVNKVTGSSYEIAAEFSFEKVAKGMKEYAQIQKEIAYGNAATKAAEREQKVLDMLASRAAKNEQTTGYGASTVGVNVPAIANIGKVGEVGKIRDTVNIASEDLKLMRELSEQQWTQNNIALTPTIQFNGGQHIRNESDIDTIIARIDQKLQESIDSGSNGVYT